MTHARLIPVISYSLTWCVETESYYDVKGVRTVELVDDYRCTKVLSPGPDQYVVRCSSNDNYGHEDDGWEVKGVESVRDRLIGILQSMCEKKMAGTVSRNDAGGFEVAAQFDDRQGIRFTVYKDGLARFGAPVVDLLHRAMATR